MPHTQQPTFHRPYEREDRREPEVTPETKVSSNIRALWTAAAALIAFGVMGALVYSDMRTAIKTAQTTAESAKEDTRQIKADVKDIAADVRTLLLRKGP